MPSARSPASCRCQSASTPRAATAADPAAVGEVVRRLVGAGAVGINIEDGAVGPDELAARVAAAKRAGAAEGVDLFVNARTDVYLRHLVPADEAIGESLARAGRYREAGADGLFVPAVADPDAIRTIAAEAGLPLNVLVTPGLPPVATLAELGVARVSAGSGIARAAAIVARRAAIQLLEEGRYDALLDGDLDYRTLNALFTPPHA